MRILIFEDNQNDLDDLLKNINTFFSATEIKYDVKTCMDPKYVLDNHFNYDMLFLDIEVAEESGIDIGCEIRKKNHDIRIIFVTNYSKYLIDGYKAQASRYFVKPIQQEGFELELKNVISDYLEEYNGFYDKTISINKIYFNKIVYIEFIKRKTSIHFMSGEVITTNYPLKYWVETLFSHDFAQPYKSFIVNLKHISGFTKNEVIMDNEEVLPISRFYKQDFETRYIDYLHRRM